MNKKAIIAMSGGVDSSVAAYIISNADMTVLALL
jgi:tRNA U34 2-thiouridine synthase MnmA/TrmU